MVELRTWHRIQRPRESLLDPSRTVRAPDVPPEPANNSTLGWPKRIRWPAAARERDDAADLALILRVVKGYEQHYLETERWSAVKLIRQRI